MNVYDFDGTIYDGESVFDFYLYSLRKKPKAIKFLFVVVKTLVLYKLCRVSEDELYRLISLYAKEYISLFDGFDDLVKDFWDKHLHKIKPWYLAQKREDDLIISASPSFLLKECFRRIGVVHAITSEIDSKTGEIKRLCFRKHKAALFKECFPDCAIDNFYTDSKNDTAMFALSQNVYLVKGNRVLNLK